MSGISSLQAGSPQLQRTVLIRFPSSFGSCPGPDMEGASGSRDKELATMVCVHCGYPAKSVFIEYSPGNIRLSTCARCHFPVDEYVEYELMIVIIDVILHKPEAYRHLFFNYPRLHHLQVPSIVWKVFLLHLLLDTCILHLKYATQGVGNAKIIQWDTLFSFVRSAGMVVTQVLMVNSAFLIFIILASRAWRGRRKGPGETIPSRPFDIVTAVVLSSHFKLFTFAMLVWEFSSLMGFVVEILVYSSNIVALKVNSKSSTVQVVAVVIMAAMVKIAMRALVGLPGVDFVQRH